MSVVQIGPLVEDGIGSATLPFAFRNNTSEGISSVDWTGTARSSRSIVATGSSQRTIPAQVQPGEVGLAFIYFDGSSELPPTDAEYEFTVNTSAADQASYNTAPLKLTEASASGDAIVGAAVNGTGNPSGARSPFPSIASTATSCSAGAFAEQDGPIAADGQVTFSADLYCAACPTFAVGVGGYFAE